MLGGSNVEWRMSHSTGWMRLRPSLGCQSAHCSTRFNGKALSMARAQVANQRTVLAVGPELTPNRIKLRGQGQLLFILCAEFVERYC
jgi:hypothetical protein